MYENNNNTVSIDWKGLFLKVIIVAIIVFAIFKGYEIFSNKKDNNSKETISVSTQLFNANLESLRQAGENYYDYTNFPSEGQTVMATLGELTTKGDIKELYDDKGNECSKENSYVSLTNDNGQYKLKATLTCGGTSNYTVVMIGCECEENICKINREESEVIETSCPTCTGKTSSKTNSTSSKKSYSTVSSSSNKKSSNKNSGATVNNNVYNNSFNTNSNNSNSFNTNSNNNNSGSNNVDGNYNNTKTTNRTTSRVTTRKATTTQYKVTFDSNGGTSVSSQYVYKYNRAYQPANPTKANARFVGWYYNGRLYDFSTEVTSNITLVAHYWQTKTLTKQVYSAGWDDYGIRTFSVTHKLAIPQEIQRMSNVKNVKIKSLGGARTLSSTYDMQMFGSLHATTFDGYNEGSIWNHSSSNINNLGRLTNISVRKENSYEYDRWVVWNASVSSQCRTPFDINGATNKCDYGIVYNVVWQYEAIV